jgi:hypothetical protein
MALFRKLKDPVEGTARVVSCSGGSYENAAYSRCWMSLVLSAPGVEPYPVETTKLVRSTKHPHPGVVLPVTIDRSRPDRFEIDWDRVPTRKEVARQQTEEAAEAMRSGGTAADRLQDLLPGATIHVEGGADDRVDQLERLAELHQSGALTDEEFAAAKRRLLHS